jgi:hypothetical protein
MDTDIQMPFSPERTHERHSTEERLAVGGAIAAEMLGSADLHGVQPTSREIADAILHWIKTGERGL